MSVSDYFSNSFGEAAKKFKCAAERAGAKLIPYVLQEHCGPKGEELSIDVALLGPQDPESIFIIISGTHGVEGFCGSGCQVGYLYDGLHDALPSGTRTVLIHALNPYGFAWVRRVNEDNVDQNRNFMDFSQPLPSSSSYEKIHDLLVPAEWIGPKRDAVESELNKFIAEDFLAFQQILTAGQYTRPTGLFYGGKKETWSNRTFHVILNDQVPKRARTLAVLDLHTGLGPPGYGEPIYPGSIDAEYERAKRWYGPEVTKTSKDAVATRSTGTLYEAVHKYAVSMEMTYLALEYGTVPIRDVLTALRADHWLYAIRDREMPLRDDIKRLIRDAFYVDKPAWKAAVYGRAADLIFRACRGMANERKGS